MKLLKSQGKGSQTKFITLGMLTGIKTFSNNSSTMKSFSQLVNPIFSVQMNNNLQNQQLIELGEWLLPMLMNGQVTVAEAEDRVAMAPEPEAVFGK